VYQQVMQDCVVQGVVEPVFFLFPAIFAAIFEPTVHEMARRICLNVFRGGMFQSEPCSQLYKPVPPVASALCLIMSRHGNGTRFLILGEEQGLRTFYETLRRMFRSKRDKVTGD
jgi:hypothetical protein